MLKKTFEITIRDDFITFGQFLKLANLISSGGEAKLYLSNHVVVVNGESENRRGRKLYANTTVKINKRIPFSKNDFEFYFFEGIIETIKVSIFFFEKGLNFVLVITPKERQTSLGDSFYPGRSFRTNGTLI